MNILIVIPARGGSKGIPRKNVRLLNGKPLIAYVIETALDSSFDCDVVVTTDDVEVKHISSLYGASVIERPVELGQDSVTLDPVIYHAVNYCEQVNESQYDIVITMQPTSPLLKSYTLDNAIKHILENDYDTIISGINEPHLSWKLKENGEFSPNYKERLNRQKLPKHIVETGAFVITKRKFVKENTRIGEHISIYEVPESESVDIDTRIDWLVAENELTKKNILIRTDGYKEIGMGHIYRGLLLAYNFTNANIKFVLSNKSDIGIEMIKNSFFDYSIINGDNQIFQEIDKFKADIVINDILNTKEEYMKSLSERNNCKTRYKIVNFEDLGPGMEFADIVINDLYENSEDYSDKQHNHVYWGHKYHCLRDEFIISKPNKFSEQVKNIIVIFGGTDPSNLTYKTVKSLIEVCNSNNIKVTVILGIGYRFEKNLTELEGQYNNIEIIRNIKLMTEYMSKADLAISSKGRTMLELAAMGVPTILLSQNKREMDHKFGSLRNGFLDLGIGEEISCNTIKETVSWLIKATEVRKQMYEHMLELDLKKGIKRVKDLILYK